MGQHWYVRPTACADCGEEWDHPQHTRRCTAIITPAGWPGFGFCQDAEGHDHPHHLRMYEGTILESPLTGRETEWAAAEVERERREQLAKKMFGIT